MPTFYKRNAGFTAKNKYLSSKKLYGELKRCASNSRTTLILPLAVIRVKLIKQVKQQENG